MVKHFSQGVDYIGTIANNLRDLEGKRTLVFELIQNADDVASADFVRFRVRDDALIVENDGRFTDCGDLEDGGCAFEREHGHECDFHRFKTIASRGKRREENTTGTFGIGFISVYQITDRPELYSGDRHWTIRPDAERRRRIKEEPTDSEFQGTRFYLPWASDPETELRREVGTGAISSSYPDNLVDELSTILPNSLLFLRNLTKIELCRGEETILTVRREDMGERRKIITEKDGERRTRTYIIENRDFSSQAEQLIKEEGFDSQEKKATELEIGIPTDHESDDHTEGRYYAYLPTRHPTGLPFHVQADFFPASDRRRIVFGEGATNHDKWNRLAAHQAYETFVSCLPRLKEELAPNQFWRVLNRVYQARNSTDSLDDGPTQDCWELLEPRLEDGKYVFTEKNRWRKPNETRLPTKAAERVDLLAEVLDLLNIEIPNSGIRQYQNLLLEIGTKRLTLEAIVSRLESFGVEEGIPREEAPEVIRNLQYLDAIFCLVGELHYDSSTETKEGLIRRLRKLPLALSTEARFHPLKEVKQFKAEYLDFLEPLSNDFVFLKPDLPEGALDVLTDEDLGLIQKLKISDIYSVLRGIPEPVLDEQWEESSSPLIQLISWLLQHRALQDGDRKQEYRRKLRNLPIWPVGDAHSTLANVVMPGGFEDPLGISNFLSKSAMPSVGRELEKVLGVERLDDFEHYVTEEVPQAFDGQSVDEDTRNETVKFLSKWVGEIQKLNAGEALYDCPIVLCQDGRYRRPEEVYFDRELVRKILGEEVSYVAEDLPHPAADNLYEEIGVESTPRPKDVVELIENIVREGSPTGSRREEIKKIIQYLGQRHSDGLQDYKALKRLEWLPVEGDSEEWYSPSDVYAPEKKYLFSSQANFVDVHNRSKADPLFRFLDLDRDPGTKQIVDHLLHLAEEERRDGSFRSIYRELSKRLEKDGKHVEEQVKRLRDGPTLYLKNVGFCLPHHVFRAKHPFGPFRYRITDRSEYASFLDYVGAKREYDEEDAVSVIVEIADKWIEEGDLNREESSVLFKSWKICQRKGLSERLIGCLQGKPVVLSAEESLVESREAFFDDHPSLPPVIEEFFDGHLVGREPEIAEVLQTVGVRSIREVLDTHLWEDPEAKLDEQATKRVHERIPLVQRVLSGDIVDRNKVDLSQITEVEILQSSELSVVTRAYAFGTEIASEPEKQKAFFDSSSNQLYVTSTNGRQAWIPAAREIASILISRRGAPRGLASGLVHVFRPATFDSAESELDDLGFPEVESKVRYTPEGKEPTALGGALDAENEEDTSQNVDSSAEQARSWGDMGDDYEIETDGDGTTLEEGKSSPSRKDGEPERGSAPETGTDNGKEQEEQTSSEETSEASTLSEGGGEVSVTDSESEEVQSSSGESGHGYRDWKLRSYIDPEPSSGGSGAGRNSDTNRAGMDFVLKYEREQGRIPEEQNHYNEGFDVKSFDEEGRLVRYIEVKSTDGPWDEFGVGMSSTQFDDAQKKDDDYWLYVVEHVKGDPELTCIRNPADQVDEYRFGDNWKELDEKK